MNNTFSRDFVSCACTTRSILLTNYEQSFVLPVFGGLSLGSGHSLVLKDDGSVWATGDNTFGQLGIDSNNKKMVTKFIKVISDGATAVAAGGKHSMVLKKDGSVWATGRNNYGQLGNGSNIDVHSFVQVILNYAKSVATGAEHSLVLMRDGRVWVAGCNIYGQLGDGSTTPKNRFVQVTTITGRAKIVAAGSRHSMVLNHDNSVWVTGDNEHGQLGDGSADNVKTSFLKVMSSGAKAIAAGDQHSMVMKQGGSLWVTGGNTYGQLGDGFTDLKRSFVQIIPSGVKFIAAGNDHSLVQKIYGSVWATGWNNFGQLGVGSSVYTSTFVPVIARGVLSLAAGDWHSMVLKNDGSLWATGANMHGQLGDGSTINENTYRELAVLTTRDGSCFTILYVHIWSRCFAPEHSK